MAYIRCKAKCPGGRDCECNGSVKHTLHLCTTKACACHSAERYGVVLSYAPQPVAVVRVVKAGELREVAA